jgi:hypothetical protein
LNELNIPDDDGCGGVVVGAVAVAGGKKIVPKLG